MASGFDATAFGTGLLSGINQQNAANAHQQQQVQTYADEKNIDALQTAKTQDIQDQKDADQYTQKVQSLASIINNNYDPDPASIQVAHNHLMANDGKYNEANLDDYRTEAQSLREALWKKANPQATPPQVALPPSQQQQPINTAQPVADQKPSSLQIPANQLQPNAPTPIQQGQIPSDPRLHPEALQGLTPGQADLVRQVAAGKKDFTGFSLRDPTLQDLQGRVSQFDDTYINSGNRLKTRSDFSAGGNIGKNINAIDTATQHLQSLEANAVSLNNDKLTPWNWTKNQINENLSDPRIAKYQADMTAVSHELSKAYKGVGATTQAEVAQFQQNLSQSKDNSSISASVNEFAQLLSGKMNATYNQYRTDLGPWADKDRQWYSPESISFLKSHGVDASKYGKSLEELNPVPQQQPNQQGQLPTFGSPQEALKAGATQFIANGNIYKLPPKPAGQ